MDLEGVDRETVHHLVSLLMKVCKHICNGSFIHLNFDLLDNIGIREHTHRQTSVSMLSSKSKANMAFDQNIQIKIALSVNKGRVFIKILAESHMALDFGDKIALPNLYPWSKE